MLTQINKNNGDGRTSECNEEEKRMYSGCKAQLTQKQYLAKLEFLKQMTCVSKILAVIIQERSVPSVITENLEHWFLFVSHITGIWIPLNQKFCVLKQNVMLNTENRKG